MSLMLPSRESSLRRLTDVLPSCFASMGVGDFTNALDLPTARCVVLVLVDGLGYFNLADGLGHASFLRSNFADTRQLSTVFPSTTATALASLATGVDPGEHGMLGYQIRNPASGRIINQLSGLSDVSDIESWLGVPTLHQTARLLGAESIVVGLPRFEDSLLTKVVHAGAAYRGANSMAERAQVAIQQARTGTHLVMLYVPELDQKAHAHGVTSGEWLVALEELDGMLRTLVAEVPSDTAVYVTADHGVIDVPADLHIDVLDPRWGIDSSCELGGEPRGLQVYGGLIADRQHLAPTDDGVDSGHDVRNVFRQQLQSAAWVVTPEDLAAAGWWAPLTSHMAPRAGETIVIPRDGAVFYDARLPHAPARRMVGQHGGLSEREISIPWARLHA
ncbi:unannotated protein [freshwater metagenome]|uniref:Unannotated protein n=1 Tax=freshwater metagenome TaxID=449393 RepID=A0A6J7GW05_9ZZZZ